MVCSLALPRRCGLRPCTLSLTHEHRATQALYQRWGNLTRPLNWSRCLIQRVRCLRRHRRRERRSPLLQPLATLQLRFSPFLCKSQWSCFPRMKTRRFRTPLSRPLRCPCRRHFHPPLRRLRCRPPSRPPHSCLMRPRADHRLFHRLANTRGEVVAQKR